MKALLVIGMGLVGAFNIWAMKKIEPEDNIYILFGLYLCLFFYLIL